MGNGLYMRPIVWVFAKKRLFFSFIRRLLLSPPLKGVNPFD